MATLYTQQSGVFNDASSVWNTESGGGGSYQAPADNDILVIQSGHTITMNQDTSGWSNGVNGLTIEGGAVTPGMLVFKYDADGTYWLKMKTGSLISGTSQTVLGRILANSDGVWANNGDLAFGRKAVIELVGTAYIQALYLDIKLLGVEPTNRYVRTYGAKYTVSDVNTSTDVITVSAAHGWSTGTEVIITSTGSVPGGLYEHTKYYLRNATTYTFQLSGYNDDNAIVDLTSVGSGTISVCSGYSSGSATVNVLEDVTSDTPWTTTDGDDYVELCNTLSQLRQHQRFQLSSISAGTITLDTTVSADKKPGARLYLVSRNVRIISNTTSTSQAFINFGSGGGDGAVLKCEMRATTATGNGYGYAIRYGADVTVSGVLSNFYYGLYDIDLLTFSGTAVACYYGVRSIVEGLTVASTAIVECSSGAYHSLYMCADIDGQIAGSSNAIYSCSGLTLKSTGAIYGCGSGIQVSDSIRVEGLIASCSNAFYDSLGSIMTSGGVIHSCTKGAYDTGPIHIAGTIEYCYYAMDRSSAVMHGATVKGCVFGGGLDAQAEIVGWGVTWDATYQAYHYLYKDWKRPEERNIGIKLYDLGGVSEYLGWWTMGGYTKTAVYSAGQHGTPPVANSYIHETSIEDNNRLTWAEWTIWALSGQQVTVTMYCKLTGTSQQTILPKICICDPAKGWQAAGEVLDSDQMASNTNWQTLSAQYTPSYDRELRVRMQLKGGTALGGGSEKLYWFHDVDLGGSGGVYHRAARLSGG